MLVAPVENLTAQIVVASADIASTPDLYKRVRQPFIRWYRLCYDLLGRGKSDDSPLMDPQRFSALSKDELKEVLLQEAEARRRAEREYQAIRDTFEEQVRKEIAYREEVAKQLQIVREQWGPPSLLGSSDHRPRGYELCSHTQPTKRSRYTLQRWTIPFKKTCPDAKGWEAVFDLFS
ncbi:hypothetical protein TNCV_2952931 [Trichonephila clavipes]|nr:hypothetical protein TNCV_2952931 [Trichonephila clavipes]